MELQRQRPKGFLTGKEALMAMAREAIKPRPRSPLYKIREQLIEMREKAAKAKKKWERLQHCCRSQLGAEQHKDEEVSAWIEWRRLEKKIDELLFE